MVSFVSLGLLMKVDMMMAMPESVAMRPMIGMVYFMRLYSRIPDFDVMSTDAAKYVMTAMLVATGAFVGAVLWVLHAALADVVTAQARRGAAELGFRIRHGALLRHRLRTVNLSVYAGRA
jgi:hypothetical protein